MTSRSVSVDEKEVRDMAARGTQGRDGGRKQRLLPVVLSALLVFPSPFVAGAAAQTRGAADSAAPAGVGTAGVAVAAANSGTAALVPLSPLAAIAPLNFAAPLSAPVNGAVAAPAHASAFPAQPAQLALPAAALAAPIDGIPGAPTRGPTAAAESEEASNGGRTAKTEALAQRVADQLVPSAAAPEAIPPADEDSPDVPSYPAGAPRTLAEASLDIPADRTYTPSPDWHAQVIESLIVDRYDRGPDAKPEGDPNDNNSRHGGDIKGLAARLDYLKAKGVTTIMVNPIVMGPKKVVFGYSGYHGYWPVHFLAVDPRLGTLEDLKELRREARKRGMYVVLDMVINHAGPVFDYKNPAPFDENGKPKEIEKWTLPLWPKDLRGSSHFVRRGVIGDWTEKAKELGDFPPNLPKLDMSDPATQRMMIHVAKYWLKEGDFDGYRLDTFQHIDPSFWPVFKKEISAYAKLLGKDDFLFIPEIYHGDPHVVAQSLAAADMKAAYNYPSWFWEKDALHGKAPTRQLEESLAALKSAFGDAAKWLVRFLENQDRPRFLGPTTPIGLLKLAYAHLLFSVGIPLFYHGPEAAFRAESDEDNGFFGSKREDMWGHFDANSPMYQHLARLTALRSRHPALQRGEQYVRWSDASGAGLYAFSRIHDKEEVLIGENTADQPRSATMIVDRNLSPPGTVFVDELDAAYSVVVKDDPSGSSELTLEIPGHGVRVLAQRPPKE
ncbi:MAG: alpha-amylase family glycosyl hydrolase [Elusimicrobiota bacterium]